jgi:hypothetical protein
MKPKDIRYRLTGLSVGTLGASWERVETERDEAKKLIIFLEDRRVLYEPFDIEVQDHCIQSVLQIRDYLTNLLSSLESSSKLAQTLRAMRASCRRFLNMSQAKRRPSHVEFVTALGELRGVFGIHLAGIAAKYALEVEDDLASILPAAPSDSD